MKNTIRKSLYVLRTDIQRITCSWRLYITITLGFVFMSRQLFAESRSWQYWSPMEMLSVPLALSDFTPFAVLFCVFPYSDSFCRDYSSHYSHLITTRTGAKQYAWNRCMSVLLSGGFTMALIMASIIVFCLCFSGKPETPESLSFLTSTIWNKMGLLSNYNGIFHYLGRILVAFLFGSVWALLSLAISGFITNTYVTILFPFVLYQMLWFLLSGMPINPVYLLRADFEEIPSFSFVVVYQCIWIIILYLTSYKRIIRKVSE